MFEEEDERRHDEGVPDLDWVEVNSVLSVSDRRALWLELVVEADGCAEPWGAGYSQSGELHGLVLTADGAEPWSGPAVRGHCWGAGCPLRYRFLS